MKNILCGLAIALSSYLPVNAAPGELAMVDPGRNEPGYTEVERPRSNKKETTQRREFGGFFNVFRHHERGGRLGRVVETKNYNAFAAQVPPIKYGNWSGLVSKKRTRRTRGDGEPPVLKSKALLTGLGAVADALRPYYAWVNSTMMAGEEAGKYISGANEVRKVDDEWNARRQFNRGYYGLPDKKKSGWHGKLGYKSELLYGHKFKLGNSELKFEGGVKTGPRKGWAGFSVVINRGKREPTEFPKY